MLCNDNLTRPQAVPTAALTRVLTFQLPAGPCWFPPTRAPRQTQYLWQLEAPTADITPPSTNLPPTSRVHIHVSSTLLPTLGNTLQTGVPHLQISCSPPVQRGAWARPHWMRLHTPAPPVCSPSQNAPHSSRDNQGLCLQAGEAVRVSTDCRPLPDHPPSSAPPRRSQHSSHLPS